LCVWVLPIVVLVLVVDHVIVILFVQRGLVISLLLIMNFIASSIIDDWVETSNTWEIHTCLSSVLLHFSKVNYKPMLFNWNYFSSVIRTLKNIILHCLMTILNLPSSLKMGSSATGQLWKKTKHHKLTLRMMKIKICRLQQSFCFQTLPLQSQR